jgi:hypothetical protein
MATQRERAEEFVARMRAVGAPASEGFFAWMKKELNDPKYGYDFVTAFSHPYLIATLICHAWIHGNRLQKLPPDVDLWPFIATAVPAEMITEAGRFWNGTSAYAKRAAGKTS